MASLFSCRVRAVVLLFFCGGSHVTAKRDVVLLVVMGLLAATFRVFFLEQLYASALLLYHA